MTNLLAVDFKRILKDKLFLIVCILAAVFAVMTPLLYTLLLGGMEDMLGAVGLSMSAKSQFFDSFSLGNNLGLIAPVLFAIILCKDFGQGTLRNKLISGNARASILLSMFTVTFVVLFGVMLLHALLTLGLALFFFPYAEGTAFSLGELGYFFTSLALELVLYVFLAALVVWLCAVMKNVGLVIVGYIAIVMGMTVPCL
jgi:ABC-type transport system involved in multi-copper enzyme maturation permease subunit